MNQFPANNPNPVFSVSTDGTILYSNEAAKTLLHEWGVEVGEKLPSYIGDFVQKAVLQNSPEKMEVKVGKRVYLIAFHPSPEDECVNIYGFDISDYKEIEMRLREAHEQIQIQSEELQISNEELQAQSDELHEANELLHDSVTGFRTLAENSPDLIARFDRQNRCLYANPAVMKYYDIPIIATFYGLSLDEFISKNNLKVQIDPEMAKLSEKQRAKVFTTGKPETVEFQYISSQGKEYYLNTKIVPEFSDGEVTSILAISRDITDIKEIEAKLKKTLDNLDNLVKERTKQLEKAYNLLEESEKGLVEAQKMAHIGNWNRSFVTDELYWSDEVYRIFGRSPQEFGATYSSFLNYVHPEDRDYVDNAVKVALKGNPYNIDFRIILADGTERVVYSKGEVIFDETNTPIRMRGTVQDITERKKAEKALELASKYNRSLIEASLDPLVTIGSDGKITDVNKATELITGYSRNELIGTDFTDYFTEPEKAKKGYQQVFLQGEVRDYPLGIRHKDGYITPVLYNASVYKDESGKVVGIFAAARDITERKMAEEALAKIEKARIKEIHHRIKNNLQVVSSLLSLEAERFSDANVLEALRESQNRVVSISIIHEELYRGNEIDILDFAAYLRKLTAGLFSLYNFRSNIILRLDLEQIYLDMDIATPLGIIVNELISNALKHAFSDRKQGEINISLKKTEDLDINKKGSEVDNECKQENDFQYTLTVADNGQGISKEIDLQDVDSLGLQLVNILVEQIDGCIELRREQGTEFIIWFSDEEK